MSSEESILEEMGLKLPSAPAAAANYVPYVVSGNMVYIAGQISKGDELLTGRLGEGLYIEHGVEAARLCALNILAQIKSAVEGDWSRVVRCVKLGGFVNSTPDFNQHPAVINGASDLIVHVLGDRGKHARFAVGAPSLPFNVAVEIDAVFEIKPV